MSRTSIVFVSRLVLALSGLFSSPPVPSFGATLCPVPSCSVLVPRVILSRIGDLVLPCLVLSRSGPVRCWCRISSHPVLMIHYPLRIIPYYPVLSRLMLWMTRLKPSCSILGPVSPHLAPYCVLFRLVLPRIVSHFVPHCPILSHLVPSCVPFRLVSPHVLSLLVQSYRISCSVSSHIVSYYVCPVSSHDESRFRLILSHIVSRFIPYCVPFHTILSHILPCRARQVKKWFTRRVLRLPGGVRYDELPSRLRVTWYTYHKVGAFCLFLSWACGVWVCLFAGLFVCLFVCLLKCLLVCLLVLCAFLGNCLLVLLVCLFACLLVCLFACLLVCLFARLLVCLFACLLVCSFACLLFLVFAVCLHLLLRCTSSFTFILFYLFRTEFRSTRYQVPGA